MESTTGSPAVKWLILLLLLVAICSESGMLLDDGIMIGNRIMIVASIA
jgi:hypothetical protein